MAVELLRSQVRHLNAEKAAQQSRKEGPPTLSTKREAYHDLESLLWVLVYSMMIHHYNSLRLETDRQEYKTVIDDYFGQGSAKTTTQRRQAMYLAHSRVGDDSVSTWFPDPDERRFFTRCMTLIAKHDKDPEEEEDCGTFDGEIDDDNPTLWVKLDINTIAIPDEDADDKSGTYKQGKVTKAVWKPVAVSRTRTHPPVITYQSVLAVLKKTIDELQ
jgi:hypothetical protein